MTCLTPNCKNKDCASLKGLCMKCYSTAKKLVESGKTTWDKLEEMGLCRQKEDAFLKAFEEKNDAKAN